jgi:hypothetical protein
VQVDDTSLTGIAVEAIAVKIFTTGKVINPMMQKLNLPKFKLT